MSNANLPPLFSFSIAPRCACAPLGPGAVSNADLLSSASLVFRVTNRLVFFPARTYRYLPPSVPPIVPNNRTSVLPS